MKKMKSSGIQWIGKIPNDWKTIKLKYLPDNNISNSFVDGDWIESPYITDFGIRYLTTGNIGDGKFKQQGSGYISDETFRLLHCKYAFPGDLIISRLNAPYGRACILPPDESKYVLAVDNVIIRTKEDKKYLCYITQCTGYQNSVQDKASGTTMKRISRTNLGNIIIPLPPVEEQHRISDYLDTKCARIDSIRKNVEAEIEALKQYKKSVITEAVTKGLDKNVEMKDSGADWVGKIPKDWIYVRLKMIAEISDGTHDTPAYVDKNENTYPLVTSKNIINGQIDFEKCHFIGAKDYEKIIKRSYYQKYDLIMPMIGSIGKPAIIKSNKEFATKNVAIIRFHGDENLSKFIYYQFYSNNLNNELKNIMSGSVQNFVSQNIIKNLLFCLPRKGTEIIKIVSYLDSKCSQIDSIVSQKQKQLEILNEYKKSLIYEYVTGKKEVPSV